MTTIRAPFRIGENLIAPDFGPEGFPPDDDNIFGAYRDPSGKSSFAGGLRDPREKSKFSVGGFANPGSYGSRHLGAESNAQGYEDPTSIQITFQKQVKYEDLNKPDLENILDQLQFGNYVKKDFLNEPSQFQPAARIGFRLEGAQDIQTKSSNIDIPDIKEPGDVGEGDNTKQQDSSLLDAPVTKKVVKKGVKKTEDNASNLDNSELKEDQAAGGGEPKKVVKKVVKKKAEGSGAPSQDASLIQDTSQLDTSKVVDKSILSELGEDGVKKKVVKKTVKKVVKEEDKAGEGQPAEEKPAEGAEGGKKVVKKVVKKVADGEKKDDANISKDEVIPSKTDISADAGTGAKKVVKKVVKKVAEGAEKKDDANVSKDEVIPSKTDLSVDGGSTTKKVVKKVVKKVAEGAEKKEEPVKEEAPKVEADSKKVVKKVVKKAGDAGDKVTEATEEKKVEEAPPTDGAKKVVKKVVKKAAEGEAKEEPKKEEAAPKEGGAEPAKKVVKKVVKKA